MRTQEQKTISEKDPTTVIIQDPHLFVNDQDQTQTAVFAELNQVCEKVADGWVRVKRTNEAKAKEIISRIPFK